MKARSLLHITVLTMATFQVVTVSTAWAQAVGSPCTTAAQCDDGMFCNGIETCDPVLGCQSGAPVDCSDGIGCTADACNEATDSCVNGAVPGVCDDGDVCNGTEICDPIEDCVAGIPLACDDGTFCNGAETCNPTSGCQAGAPVECSDGVACTVDACNEGTQSCTHTADDTACQDGLFCDGVEICNPTQGCQAGTLPCNDGVGCTLDLCNEAADTCTHLADDLGCNDGFLCNGVETCDSTLDCVSGPPPSCDDGVACTADSCDPGLDDCLNAPSDAACTDGDACNGDETCTASGCQTGTPLVCDDGAFCTGIETCDPASGCVPGTPPDCDDGIGCTTDLCNEATDGCDNTPNDSICDDGLFCTGAETCSPLTGCVTAPPVDCSDGVSCTVDACNEAEDRCDNQPNDVVCNDGDLCNGSETCDPVSGCQSGLPLSCADGNACTDDLCDPSTGCANPPFADGTSCSDGNACSTSDTCTAGSCTGGPAPNCDDGNPCTVDACDAGSGCTHTPVANGTSCGDADACNGAETCQAGSCVAGAPLACNDGLFCNGIETCDPVVGCKPGTAPCKDAIGCTLDSCSEATDTCTHTANDLACDDGAFCNGAETCSPTNGCQAGSAPSCDDGISCTIDSCSVASNACRHDASDAHCDDGDVCNGLETCSPTTGCQVGQALVCEDGNACTADSCSPQSGCSNVQLANGSPCDDGDVCTQSDSCFLGACVAGGPIDCDDANPCTLDTCGPAGCSHAPVANGTSCSDADLCNGAEVCQAGACTAGTPLSCEDGRFCNGVETCDPLLGCRPGTSPCNDGVPCTLDACNEALDFCIHDPEDLSCIDGLFCNGTEYCDPVLDCQPGIPPTCDDGVGCTVDSCNESIDGCDNLPDPSPCQDGDPCNGAEVCDDLAGCVAGSVLDCDDDNPCTVDSCDASGCRHDAVANGTPCDDGNVCTQNDICSAGTCASGAPLACDDGLFCNGAETCDAVAGCQPGIAPQCDDAIGCTTDGCNEDTDSCDHAPSDSACDDSLHCNGAETCDPIAGCQAGQQPSCDDGVACTVDSCNEASDGCDHIADASLCADGDACNGDETCDPISGCQAGASLLCDDGNPCTVDGCDAAGGCQNVALPDATPCEDGNVCNGAETCSNGTCTAGTALACADTNPCTIDTCDPMAGCQNPAAPDGTACPDANLCNGTEICTAGACGPGPALVCDDGRFCNGAETCDPALGCRPGIEPCEDSVGCTLDACVESTDSCIHEPDDFACLDGSFCNGLEFCDPSSDCTAGDIPDCDDGFACTTDSCNDAASQCDHTTDDAACDDANVCNGVETCTVASGCQNGSPLTCDDGQFCNGLETCDPASGCASGEPPCEDDVACTLDACSEALDDCLHTPDNFACDDGIYCNGAETCDTEIGCTSGSAPNCDDGVACTTDSCNEQAGRCDNLADAALCQDGDLCNGTETCDPTIGCQAGAIPSCDDANPCTADGCDAVAGCTNVQVADATPCDDGDVCFAEDTCLAGLCTPGTPVDCDDGNPCTLDSCDPSGGCQHEVLADGTTCEDGDLCTRLESCQAGTCVATAPVLCDDGRFCNGTETCDPAIGCVAGTPPCTDTIGCTVDICNEAADQCSHTPNDLACTDGVFCNGEEVCDVALGCVSGPSPTCDDGVACTVDSCSIAANACSNVATNALCDDGLFCDGAETCNPTSGCVPGTAPDPDDGVGCTIDACDEANDVLVNSPENAACDDGEFCNGVELCDAVADCQPGSPVTIDDGVGCTADSCDEVNDTIVHNPIDSVCDDGAFCNGAETCDLATDCQPGVPPLLDDGVACTDDACDEDADLVVHTANDALCDDGLFCTGVETCDAIADCQDGADPDLDDGVACTTDSCDDDADLVVHQPEDAACDDGAFCNGAETCDAVSDCQAGSAPETDDGIACTLDVCDEINDAIVNQPEDSLCDDGAFCNGSEVCDPLSDCQAGPTPVVDDGVGCTTDLCDEILDVVVNTPDDAICDDGLFCNGQETCDLVADCRAGVAPALDDGVGCTLDSCDEDADTVIHLASDALCDDGLFCNGAETCDAGLDCQAGVVPAIDDGITCTLDACDEVADVVVHTPTDAICDDAAFCNGSETCDSSADCQPGIAPTLDDGVGCTLDSCDEIADVVLHTPSDSICDDGLFCNGSETCDAATDCAAGTAPLVDDEVGCTLDACDEAADVVVHTPSNSLCDDQLFCNGLETCDVLADCQDGAAPVVDDGIACTVDSCDEAADVVLHVADDTLCADPLFCNGAEICDPLSGCLAGDAPATDDGVGCTIDACDESSDAVVHLADDSLCNDTLFCNGKETCDATSDCQNGAPPETDDGVSCTMDVCDELSDMVVHTAEDSLCDDGMFCNGSESCDEAAGCQAGAPPETDDGVGCTIDACDEANDVVVHSVDDALCDDDAFCNGVETCDAALDCQAGEPPIMDDAVACTTDSCDESTDMVVHAPVDALCDDGLFCNGSETCDAVLDCQSGQPPLVDDGVGCTFDECDEAADTVAHTPQSLLCDDGNPCTDDACDALADCQHDPNTSACDDADPCTIDDVCSLGSCGGTNVPCDSVFAPAGGGPITVTTDDEGDGATPSDPIETTVTSPNGGPVSIAELTLSGGALAVEIEAPTATPEDPLIVTYRLDASLGLPVDVQFRKDGMPVPACTGAPGVADPDPCIPSRTILADGDLEIVVLTSSASLWDFGTVDSCTNASTGQPVMDGVACDDGDACTEADACASGACVGLAKSCDDGDACTLDSCDTALGCLYDAVVCDDGVGCTIDSCDAIAGCLATPDDSVCDNGEFCDGVEACDVAAGCQPGTPPNCNDGVGCTADACDEGNDACSNTPMDVLCNDGVFCNGIETCDAATDCQPGIVPACDDGVACTQDVCDDGSDACAHAPVDATCDDGLFCNGAETCDSETGCQVGAPVEVDDGIPCTYDSCDEGADAVMHAPDDLLCDDGQYCNGAETCDAGSGCQAGIEVDPNDGIACTDDLCDELLDQLVHSPSDPVCDDGLFCNGTEICDLTSGCQAGISPSTDDGVACTDDSCDEATDSITHLPNDALCDDGGYCNGAESCDLTSDCQPGTPPSLDDGVACTDDSCDEATDSIAHTPNDAYCEDGVGCTDDVCDLVADCQYPANDGLCDDGVGCTDDVCDVAADCQHTPNDGLCEDGVGCTDDVCDVVADCQYLANDGLCDDGVACTNDVCDVAADCQYLANDALCADGVGCTDDVCDVAADCQHTANDGLCDDGLYCNGSETCDLTSDCQVGASPSVDDGVGCTDDSCDEATDAIVHVPNDGRCDDGVGCTDDSCDLTADCQHAANDGLCDDAIGCTDDACDLAADCQHTPDDGLCDDGVGCTDDACDLTADCQHTANDGLCDDGIGCTDDACDIAADCKHAANDDLCDDGLYCNGAETCDVAADCQTGAAPSLDDGIACTDDSCDEAADAIVHAPNDGLCDDAVGCTDDVCDLTADCQHTANDGLCDDAIGCTDDTCDQTGDCQHAANDGLCDDGIGCTDDACDLTADCQHAANDGLCDDGLYCNGAETCDVAVDCQTGAAPSLDDGIACTDDSCDEATDTIVHAPNDGLCDDSVGCTDDSCDLAADCQHAANDGLCNDGIGCTDDACDLTADCQHAANDGLCDDGLYCNGAETCDVAADCQTGAAPSTDDGIACTDDSCDEATDTIVHAPNDGLCDDAVGCTDDSCDLAADCQHTTNDGLCDDAVGCTDDVCDLTADCQHAANDGLCDDGLYCNGAETCDLGADCQTGAAPSTDDGIACTDDSCDEATNSILHTPNDGLCDNGLYCDGVETCSPAADCQPGTAPSLDDGVSCTDDSCDEEADLIVHRPTDAHCDNGQFCDGSEICDAAADCIPGIPPTLDDAVPCTDDSCDEILDVIINMPNDGNCDDGLYCNGPETCDLTADCQAGTAPDVDDGVPCTDDGCDEASDAPTHVPNDANCDDGLFCNGAEACDATIDCRPGIAPPTDDGIPCTVDACDEASDAIVNTPDDTVCQNGLYCDGMEICDPDLSCQPGLPPDCDDSIGCTNDRCDESTNGCAHDADDALCDDADACNGIESCDQTAGCQLGVTLNCDDGNPCTNDACDPVTGCSNTNNALACDDGAACTTGDVCQAGVCRGASTCGAGLSCDLPTGLCITPPDADNDGIVDELDPCPGDARNACFGTPAIDTLLGKEIRVNANVSEAECSGEKVDCNGTVWHGDFGYNQPGKSSVCNLGVGEDCVITGITELFGCEDESTEDMFQCDHWDVPLDPELAWTFAVPNGRYLVNLFFANIYTGTSTIGSRVFDIAIEGAIVYPAFDQVAAAGGNGIAVVRSAVVDVNDLSLNIELLHGIENPSIKAIEVLAAGDCLTDGDCNDGNACNGLESCQAHQCTAGAPLACDDGLACNGVESCDPVTGCVSGTIVDCDDGVACTVDTCQEPTGDCQHSAADAYCDDGLFCNGAETCDETLDCRGGIPPACDDGVECTADSCDESAHDCAHAANDGSCDDGLYCTGVERCVPAVGCQAGSAPMTDDGIGCTIDYCDEVANAVVHAADDSLCQNGVYCDGAEQCDPTLGCQAGIAPDCNDGVACTVDHCSEVDGTCSHVADDGVCDDGAFCNGTETCDATTGCASGSPPLCDDGVDCTVDGCDDASGCTAVPDDGACQNGDLCDGIESCDASAGCQAGTAPDCNDDNACTDDSCAAASGCVNAPVVDGTPCSDGDVCATADACQAGTCTAGIPIDCDDGDACTLDRCDATGGCTHETAACDDGNPCTDDACNPISGCENVTLTDGTDCGDGDACNGIEVCSSGSCTSGTPPTCDDGAYCNGTESCDPVSGCVPGTAVTCDDGVDCTIDACDESTDSCTFSPNDQGCDDGLHCNGVETCDPTAGCTPAPAVACDDGIACTIDSCDESADTCTHVVDDAACDDGLFCNGSESCLAGVGCQAGTAVACDDGSACTLDACDEQTGACSYVESCPAGKTCNTYLGECRVPDPRVWIPAAGWPASFFTGAMTATSEFAGGTDADPLANSLLPQLVFANSATNSYNGGSGDKVTYTVQVPASGPWYLWGRFYYPGAVDSNQANSFLVSIDGGAPFKFGNKKGLFQRWHWDGDGSIETGGLIPLALGYLSAGTHTLLLEKREVVPVAPRIDVMVLTQTPSPPPGDGDAVAALGEAGYLAATTTTMAPTTTTSTTTTTLPLPCVDDSACSDGLFCNGVETCSGGVCVPGVAPSCDDGIACTTDACSAALDACSNLANPSACSDGNACNGAEVCSPSAGCQPGLPLACDDGNPCTDDACDALAGCVATANQAPCDDGIACTTADVCTNGACTGIDACVAGEVCNLSSGACDSTADPRIWIAAAGDPTAVFGGAMTTSTQYALGDDNDLAADSLIGSLAYAASSSNSFNGTSADVVTYTIDVPHTGTWYAWGRFYYPGTPGSNEANSFMLSVDGAAPLKFGNKRDRFQKWHWDGNGNTEIGAVTPLSLGVLTAGIHQIAIHKREVTPVPPRLDAILVTPDGAAVPSDAEALLGLTTAGALMLTTPTSTLP